MLKAHTDGLDVRAGTGSSTLGETQLGDAAICRLLFDVANYQALEGDIESKSRLSEATANAESMQGKRY